MLRILLPVASTAIVVGVYHAVASRCGRTPDLRRWFVVGAVAAFGLAGLLVPWVLAKLEPPFSESPSGLFVILGKAAVVGLLVLGAVGTLLGAAFPKAPRS